MKEFEGKTILLAGDSRSSQDYTFYGDLMREKTGAKVLVEGASGWNVAMNASDAYFERLIKNPHDFSIWIVGGNDIGNTVGTFDSDSLAAKNEEPVVTETDITKDYDGHTFIQAVDHMMRKYKALFYDWKKLDNGHKPKMIFCTDLPQQRENGEYTWSRKSNWERKNRAIIECCRKNNVALLDLYSLCNFDMSFEPIWTAPTDMIHNNGLYYMDGLHPNEYGCDIITSLEIDMMKRYMITK